MPNASRVPPLSDLDHARRKPRALAKRVLKSVRARDAAAIELFAQHHPHGVSRASQPKLADAQLVVARMLGYRSWPRLQHHRAELNRAEQEIESGAPAPDSERTTAHVRCGSDIQNGLLRAGYQGRFVEFADPLCHGPVPAGTHEALVRTRAQFIADAYELPLEEAKARLDREWAALRGLSSFERIVLWYEHDAYDQLSLAAVLHALRPLQHPCVQLICIDEYPGEPAFRGLGELREPSLRALWNQRRPVDDAMFALGTAVWNGLRSPDPRGLHALASAGTPEIPPMAGALRRHLMELPWTSDGLSLTQRLILESVVGGAVRVGRVVAGLLTTADPLPFLGDAMAWWEVRELAAGGAVALTSSTEPWHRWGVGLTDLGRALLGRDADWLERGGRTRWVGGIECGFRGERWRWDEDRRQPMRDGPARRPPRTPRPR